MLKKGSSERRKKMAKYMKVVQKANRPKTRQHYDIEVNGARQEIKEEEEQLQIQHEAEIDDQQQQIQAGEVQAWHDSDDDNQVDLDAKNFLKKLKDPKKMTDEETVDQSTYESRLRNFHNKRLTKQFTSWAKQGEAQPERNYQDFINDEQLLEAKFLKNQQFELNYVAKTQKKHDSVVTQIVWKNKVIFSTGLDKTLRIWSLDEDRPNFDHTLVQEKSVYFQNMPLTGCVNIDKKLYLGTLRKNFAILDVEKFSSELITCPFLKEDYQSYGNLRATDKYVGIFSKNKLGLLNHNNQFIGELQANEQLVDVVIGEEQVLGLTKEALYTWSLKKMRVVDVSRQGLNHTCMNLHRDTGLLSIGTRSGVVYLHRHQKPGPLVEAHKQVDNLVTSITGMSSNRSGSLLAIYSKWKRNAVRLVDTLSNKVVATWPNMHTKLNYPMSVEFSNSGQYLGVAGTNGAISAYKFVYE